MRILFNGILTAILSSALVLLCGGASELSVVSSWNPNYVEHLLLGNFGIHLLPSRASAHGGGTPRLTNSPVGPYRLYVWSSPEPLRVGEIHLTFALVLPPDGNTPVDESRLFNNLDQVVTGAEIEVQFLSTDGVGEQFKIMAAPSSINPLYYETDTRLPSQGNWQINIGVKGELGEGAASFSSSVEARRRVDWKVIGGVSVAFFFLIYVGRMRSIRARDRESRN